MIKIFLIIMLISIVSCNAFCQKCKKRFAGRTNGYIITMKLDTVPGFIKWKNSVTNQYFVEFYDAAGCFHEYAVDSLDVYKYEDWSFTQCYYNDKKLWLRQRTNGHIKLFEYWYWKIEYKIIPHFPFLIMFPMVVYNYVIQVGNNEIRNFCTYNFKSEARQLLSANKELSEKIGKRKYKYRHINKIIVEYNTWYEQKKDSFNNIIQEKENKAIAFLNSDEFDTTGYLIDNPGSFIEQRTISTYIKELTIVTDNSYSIFSSGLQLTEKDTSYEAYYARLAGIIKNSGKPYTANIIRNFTPKGHLKEIGYQVVIDNESRMIQIIKIGVWHYFNKNDIVYYVESYDLDGKKDGIWSYFDVEGTKYKEIIYKSDKRQQANTY